MLTLEPLTAVKDLVIVGNSPAAGTSFSIVRSNGPRLSICGVFSDEPIEGKLGSRLIGDVNREGLHIAEQDRIVIRFARYTEARHHDLMEFCERNTIRFRVIPSAESFIP